VNVEVEYYTITNSLSAYKTFVSRRGGGGEGDWTVGRGSNHSGAEGRE